MAQWFLSILLLSPVKCAKRMQVISPSPTYDIYRFWQFTKRTSNQTKTKTKYQQSEPKYRRFLFHRGIFCVPTFDVNQEKVVQKCGETKITRTHKNDENKRKCKIIWMLKETTVGCTSFCISSRDCILLAWKIMIFSFIMKCVRIHAVDIR